MIHSILCTVRLITLSAILVTTVGNVHAQTKVGEYTVDGPIVDFLNLFQSSEPSLRKVRSMLRKHRVLKAKDNTNVLSLSFDRPIDHALNTCVSAMLQPCDIEIVEFLIDQGADVNAKNKRGGQSVLNAFLTTLKFAFTPPSDFDPAQPSIEFVERIRTTGRENYIRRLNLLLDNGAVVPDYDDLTGLPTFLTAVAVGGDVVKLLKDAGGNPAPAIGYFERELADFELMKVSVDAWTAE